MILETVSVGQFEVNCYILAAREGSSAIIIDPGADDKKIKQALIRHKLKPAMIINTHGHFDHIGCDDKFDIPVYVHQDDLALMKDSAQNLSDFIASGYTVKSDIKTLRDKEEIESEGIQLEVIHTPGHTPGGICLLMKKPRNDILFSGDTLFFQSVGRTDFPGASQDALIGSIKKRLLVLPDEIQVYPGHGPTTTIGREKNYNSFLS